MDSKRIGLAAADTIDLLEERARDTHEVEPEALNILETAMVVRYRVADDEYIVYRAASASALHTAKLLNDAANLALDVSR